jgi:ubiquinone/menaquinone biosynthesis C-methylase UbiE
MTHVLAPAAAHKTDLPAIPVDERLMDPIAWWKRIRWDTYAPVYDLAAAPMEAGRERAIERLDPAPNDRILLLGCGTGLDLEHLPAGASITAVDRSPAMLRRAERRADRLGLDIETQIGDAESLPFADDAFDAVCLHLVLSVVEDPRAVVAETARVLAPDGRASVFDKFLPPEEAPSLLRRAANPVARLLFSDLNRRLEAMLADTDLAVVDREPFLGNLYATALLRHEGLGAGTAD